MLVKGFVVIIGFPCTTILLTNSASSLRILGTLNGFATTFSGLGRAIGPAAVGAVFSWGVRQGYAIAPWWLLGVIAMLGTIPPWFIVEGEGPTQILGARGEEEEEDNVEVVSLLRGEETESDGAELSLDSEGGGKRDKKAYGTMSGSTNGTSS